MCVGYNTLAFNPNVTYAVWQGQDDAATPVTFKNAWLYNGGTDASPNYNVRKNPYVSDSSSVNRTDLAATNVMAYWAWTDSNGDGKFDTASAALRPDNTTSGIDVRQFDHRPEKELRELVLVPPQPAC